MMVRRKEVCWGISTGLEILHNFLHIFFYSKIAPWHLQNLAWAIPPLERFSMSLLYNFYPL